VQSSPYTIYSASAGSGKTSTLVKEYLKLVLDTASPGKFRQILAITFTNKAVNEMKSRILESLHDFSQTETLDSGSHLFRDLCNELGRSPEELRDHSEALLKQLLHNYAFFDVSTIDKFTHRLIRTFARDLKLPQNFEVVLDTDLLLEEAIGRLLGKAGEDKELTEVLIAFALEKIDDDRSWDIGYDLFAIGKLLFNENQLEHISQLQDKDLRAFQKLKKHLRAGIAQAEDGMRHLARDILDSMAANNLERSDFSGGYFPDFMTDIQLGEFQKLNFDARWKQNFDEAPPYNKSCPEPVRSRIEALLPGWRASFRKIRQLFQQWSLLQNAYKNLVPLTILNAINRELDSLEKERDQLPISSFNRLISEEIKDQPAPFIYERLGEKYRHYFIDEFQDTSRLQWRNLIPLIANALESSDTQGKRGTLLLVGDAKQAIYRWRGGRAEQFLNLIQGKSTPFTVIPQVSFKKSNYRSSAEVVNFNNDFFHHISSFLQNNIYRELYETGSGQEARAEEGGQVHIEFIKGGKKREKDEQYCASIYNCIANLGEQGYPHRDICILTRTRAQGVVLAEFLLQKAIPVISSETLLLQGHPKIRFLLALLQYCQQPGDRQAGFDILYFLSEGSTKHQTISRNLDNPGRFLLEQYGFSTEYVRHASVYDGLEYAIRCFQLAGETAAYLTFLLDEVLAVEQKEDSSIPTFLDHWEKHKDRLSISAPEAMDAIRIMTIHKAKGLEFPIVLFPYANTDLHGLRSEKDARSWLPVNPSDYAGFSELLLTRKKEMATYGEVAEELYRGELEKLELDAINVLYVACTRAEKALFVFSEKEVDSGGNPKTASFSGLLIHYLMARGHWEPERSAYTFGHLGTNPKAAPAAGKGVFIPQPYSFKDRTGFRMIAKSGMLWGSERGEAITRGNLIHELMAQVETRADLEPALQRLVRHGMLDPGGLNTLRHVALSIMDDTIVGPYYQDGLRVLNETEIITAEGRILRPDRIVFQDLTDATLIDYKAGKPDPRYAQQLEEYARAIENMGFRVKNKIIVYINEGVTPELI